MSTRREHGKRASEDPAEALALLTNARRERLLAIHKRRLPRADLEDCYSQATLELLLRLRRAAAPCSEAHMANAFEQRLLSRIHDRRRALRGRSPIEAALAAALPLGDAAADGLELSDARADVERLAIARQDLRRIRGLVHELSRDQRLVLMSQLWGESDRERFCDVHGWSAEKYRKVAQRARARLRELLDTDARVGDSSVPLGVARRSREQGHTYEHSSPTT